MKKKVFSIMAIVAIAMTSCEKEEVLDSNQLGQAVITGNVWADLDGRDDVDASGLYIPGLNPENVEGITVTAEVDTENWDQSPSQDPNYIYAKKTYSAVTDASGNYTLTIPATDKAYQVELVFGTIYTTKYIYTTDGSEESEGVSVTRASVYVDIHKGAAVNIRSEANNVNQTNGNATEYGSVTFQGNVYVDWDGQIAGSETAVGSAVIGKTLEFSYRSGYTPSGVSQSTTFSAVIAADGSYSVTVPTNINGSHYIALKMDDFIGSYTDIAGFASTSIYGYSYDDNWKDGSDGGLYAVDIYLNSTPQ